MLVEGLLFRAPNPCPKIDDTFDPQMIGSSLHTIPDIPKHRLTPAGFWWIVCCLLTLFSNSAFAKWAEPGAKPLLSDQSYQNSAQKASSHNCACGMACKTRCCCVGKPAEDQKKSDEVVPPELLTKSKADCGCQISPSGDKPVPSPNSESKASGLRSSQNACLSIPTHQLSYQGDSKFLVAIEVMMDSIFEAPPDPPPPNNCLII